MNYYLIIFFPFLLVKTWRDEGEGVNEKGEEEGKKGVAEREGQVVI